MSIRSAIISILLAMAVIGFGTYVFMRTDVSEAPLLGYVATKAHEGAVPEEGAFEYEVVASPEARTQGLSGRADVPGNYGMLFVFPTADRYGFWMKDMLVPIDIVWLKDDGTILEIDEDVSPDTYPAPFYPPEAVSFVLETRAGEARLQGWEPGTRLALPVSQ